MTAEYSKQDERVLIEPDGSSVPLASRIIYLYENQNERARFAQFIALGLAEKDKCIIATDEQGRELFTQALDRLGVDAGKRERDGSLAILTDEITVENLEAIIRPLFDDAQARFRYVRLINDTSYMSAKGFTSRDFLHLEGTGHLLVPRQPCTIICQYDTSLIERQHLHHIIAAHQFTASVDSAQAPARLEENADRRPFTQIIFDGMDEQLRALSRLQDLSLKLTASLGLNETLGAIIEAAMTICRADHAAISQIADNGELTMLRHCGLTEDYIKMRGLNRDDPSVANMIATKRPFIVEDVDALADTSSNYPAWKLAGIRSVVRLPLVSEGEVFGIISAASDSPRNYTQTEIDAMAILASQASAAIINARLFEQLRQANQAKDEFLATLSHELRTPLTPILGWMDILKPFAGNDPLLSEGLESIERNTRQQAGLINDLLDLTRITSGKLELSRQPTDLIALVQASADQARAQAAARKITIHTDLPSEPVTSNVDPVRIQQIMSNLLNNAVKFNNEGGQVWITLRREPATPEGSVIIEVADDGAGIEPEFLPLIFNRFTQAEGGINRRHSGLGLGLAITRAMVELHGGEITAHSEGAGRGSRFTVKLPCADDTPPRKEETPSEIEEDLCERLGLRVLLVEDSSDAIAMMEMWLVSFGCEVQTATEAIEAIKLAAEIEPDLIISDIGLPEMDGYEMMRKLRKMPGLESVPAIAISGYARDEDRDIALAAGYNAHMSKPTEMGRLLKIIKELTGK